MRLGLLENVTDEHGGGELSHAHEATFLMLLDRLGVPPENTDSDVSFVRQPESDGTAAGVSELHGCAHGGPRLGEPVGVHPRMSARDGTHRVWGDPKAMHGFPEGWGPRGCGRHPS